ncbi:MAG: transglycosylase SLT domain-containing protein [bacterium]|nr:transglycosylase SLT domain-containing protein [bacterium]
MIHIERLGIYLSKPVAFLMMVIYLVQSGLLVYLITDKFDLEKQIDYQQSRIIELEDKLKLYKVIEDLEIGFSDDEVTKLTNTIWGESKKYNYDPIFVVSVIMVESTFKKNQVSDSGAAGLMQLRPFVAKSVAKQAGVEWAGVPTLHEPEANIKLGTYYLFEQILKYGDIRKGLVAYNIGETRLRDLIRNGQPLPVSYMNKVMSTYKRLKESYQV